MKPAWRCIWRARLISSKLKTKNKHKGACMFIHLSQAVRSAWLPLRQTIELAFLTLGIHQSCQNISEGQPLSSLVILSKHYCVLPSLSYWLGITGRRTSNSYPRGACGAFPRSIIREASEILEFVSARICSVLEDFRLWQLVIHWLYLNVIFLANTDSSDNRVYGTTHASSLFTVNIKLISAIVYTHMNPWVW